MNSSHHRHLVRSGESFACAPFWTGFLLAAVNLMLRPCVLAQVLLFSVNAAKPLSAATVSIWGDSDANIADVVAKVSGAGTFDSVVGRNLSTQGLPTLSQLSTFEAILVFGGHIQWTSSLRTSAGNLLAQYADQGGGVVTSTFVLGSTLDSWVLGGQWANSRYQVMIPVTSQSQGTELTLGTVYQPTHPIMSDVLSFDGGQMSYRANITSFAPGIQRIADWSNGAPLIAIKEASGMRRRVDLNFYPPSSSIASSLWNVGTDGDEIMANSLQWAAVPEPSTIVLAGISLFAFALFSLRNRRK